MSFFFSVPISLSQWVVSGTHLLQEVQKCFHYGHYPPMLVWPPTQYTLFTALQISFKSYANLTIIIISNVTAICINVLNWYVVKLSTKVLLVLS